MQGSHHILARDGHPRSVPVPVHGHHDLGRGLIAAIERKAESS
ncbi:MAG: type II toxin-antitoxin system HicA family toxin [Acidithiobacillus sp.]